ncbi:MAG: response regulator [Candidatus Aminicenantales bacterium]
MTAVAPRPRILIVEDEIIIAMEIQIRLEHEGFDVCGIAASGEKAVLIAREKSPDLVLMDITLRGELDGLETAGLIQKERPIPVIFLSASDNQTVLHQIHERNLGDIIAKPFRESDLFAAIRLALGI